MYRFTVMTMSILGMASCATSGENDASVPFEFRGSQIVLTANLDSSTSNKFLLDTGVNPSVIHLPLAERLDFEIDRSVVGEADGAGDGVGLEIMLTSIPSIRIAGQRFDDIEAVTADMSPFADALRMNELGGILGYSFLNERAVRIDYPARRVSIASKPEWLGASKTKTNTRVALPLTFLAADDPIPLIPVVIKGDPIVVTIDTGSSGGIELFPQTVEQLRLDELRESGTTSEAVGARGKRTLQKASIDDVFIGDTRLNGVELRFSNRGTDETKRDGNAGNKLFQDFVMTFDYVNMELILER